MQFAFGTILSEQRRQRYEHVPVTRANKIHNFLNFEWCARNGRPHSYNSLFGMPRGHRERKTDSQITQEWIESLLRDGGCLPKRGMRWQNRSFLLRLIISCVHFPQSWNLCHHLLALVLFEIHMLLFSFLRSTRRNLYAAISFIQQTYNFYKSPVVIDSYSFRRKANRVCSGQFG